MANASRSATFHLDDISHVADDTRTRYGRGEHSLTAADVALIHDQVRVAMEDSRRSVMTCSQVKAEVEGLITSMASRRGEFGNVDIASLLTSTRTLMERFDVFERYVRDRMQTEDAALEQRIFARCREVAIRSTRDNEAALQSLVCNLRDEVGKLQNSLSDALVRIDSQDTDVRSTLRMYRDEILSLREQIRQLHNEQRDCTVEASRFVGLEERVVDIIRQMESQRTQSAARLSTLESDLHRYKEVNEELRQSESRGVAQQIRVVSEAAMEASRRADDDVDTIRQAVAELVCRTENLETEVKVTKQYSDEIRQGLQSTIADHENQLHRSSTQISDITKEFRSTVDHILTRVSNGSDESLRQWDDVKRSRESTDGRLTQCVDHIRHLQHSHSETQKEIATTTAAIENLTRSLQSLRVSNEEGQAAAQRRFSDAISNAEGRWGTANKEILGTIDRLSRSMRHDVGEGNNSLLQRLRTLASDVDDKIERVTASIAQQGSRSGDIQKSAERAVSHVRDDLQVLTHQLTAVQDSTATQIATLGSEIRRLIEEGRTADHGAVKLLKASLAEDLAQTRGASEAAHRKLELALHGRIDVIDAANRVLRTDLGDVQRALSLEVVNLQKNLLERLGACNNELQENLRQSMSECQKVHRELWDGVERVQKELNEQIATTNRRSDDQHMRIAAEMENLRIGQSSAKREYTKQLSDVVQKTTTAIHENSVAVRSLRSKQHKALVVTIRAYSVRLSRQRMWNLWLRFVHQRRRRTRRQRALRFLQNATQRSLLRRRLSTWVMWVQGAFDNYRRSREWRRRHTSILRDVLRLRADANGVVQGVVASALTPIQFLRKRYFRRWMTFAAQSLQRGAMKAVHNQSLQLQRLSAEVGHAINVAMELRANVQILERDVAPLTHVTQEVVNAAEPLEALCGSLTALRQNHGSLAEVLQALHAWAIETSSRVGAASQHVAAQRVWANNLEEEIRRAIRMQRPPFR